MRTPAIFPDFFDLCLTVCMLVVYVLCVANEYLGRTYIAILCSSRLYYIHAYRRVHR